MDMRAEKVRQLYEKYPYPSRDIVSAKKLKKYSNWLLRIIHKKNAYWRGKNVLELGCGTGELANSIASEGGRVSAIDFSHSSIKKAKELSEKFSLKTICFEEKDILSYRNTKRFDTVIALGSLHHTTDARKGFLVAVKHTKKGGIVIVGLYNKYSRFRHRVRRLIIRVFAGDNFEKRISVGKKLFGGNQSRAWLADKYGQVHESYHSVSEVLKWFEEEEIDFVASKPVFQTPVIDEIKWFLGKRNAFFVMVGKKK